jgi:hypothetical protein
MAGVKRQDIGDLSVMRAFKISRMLKKTSGVAMGFPPAVVAALALVMLCACSKSNTPETSVPGSDVNLAYGTKVSFGTGGNSEPLRVSGWSGTESQMTWTEGTAAVLAMRVSPTNEPVALKMKLAGLTKDPELPYQPVEVYVNDQKVADWQLAADPAEFSASIPQEITRRGGLPRITLKIPKATSPKVLGMGAGPRILGAACFDLQLALKAG